MVDDDALVLQNTAAMLDDLGYKVLEASSGQEALDMLRRAKSVDLVITDQAMPKMTGVQLAEAIKSTWPNLPVILASGYAEIPSDSNPVLVRLSKPFRQEALSRAINESIPREETSRVLPFRPATG